MKNRKRIITIVVLVLIIAASAIFIYARLNKILNENAYAQEVIQDAENYAALTQEIKRERNRCNDIIVQESGNFAEFEYCQQFLRWSREYIEE